MTANYKPTPIQFTDTYEGGKMRRLSQQVTDLANSLGSVANKATSGSVPNNGTTGEVLTWEGSPTWAAPAVPASYPWAQLSGVPTSFPASPFLLATPAGLGPLPGITGASPGMTLVATGASAARLQFLNYSQLGDVNIAGLADGYVPAWSVAQSKWVMVPNGAGFSGLTPGFVYTAVSPTAAQFLPLAFTGITGTATPAQIGSGTPSYGAGDPKLPQKSPAGNATLYSEINQATAFDTVLTGDGLWTNIRDIEISWAQLSDVPPQVTFTGNRKQVLAGDQTWVSLPTPVTYVQQFGLPGDDGMQGDDSFIPGPVGPQGIQGPAGSGGSGGGMSGIIWPDDGAPGDDGFPMPGIQGAAGATGPTGPPGFGTPIPGDDGAQGDDGIPIPGPQGATGLQGVAGFPSIHLWADDGNTGDDGQPMPGIQGAPGAPGSPGAAGAQGQMVWADDGTPGDDGIPIVGAQGPQGPAGSSGASGSPIVIPGDDGLQGDDGMIMPIVGPILNAMQIKSADTYISTFGGGAF